MNKKQSLLILFFSVLFTSCHDMPQSSVFSVDERIEVVITQNENGNIEYAVTLDDSLLVANSQLGLKFSDGLDMSENLSVKNVVSEGVKESWVPIWGTDSLILNEYNQMTLTLLNPEYHILKIVFRVFDDGLGFRYEIPEQEGIDSLLIIDELTEFNFVQNATAWSIPANYGSYESTYRTTLLDSVQSANTPLTFRTDNGTHVSVHEANLTDYAGMTLQNIGGKSFTCDLVPWSDGTKVKAFGTIESPWRTLTITDDAAGLIESKLILNLNEPSKIDNSSWIEPMKYIGIWWGMHLGTETWTMGPKHGATTENMKRYIDFAANHNIDAVLAEGWNTGWENWGKPEAFDQTTPYADFDFEQIVDYAKNKNIELIGHHETGGDIITYETRLDSAMKMLADNGIRTLKTGYAGPIPEGQFHHGQWMVRHYRKVVETAAKYHLMLDVHEPIKATGISRTWPNMMTREGVRGMEWNAWSEGNSPEHHVIIPFTRGLGGPIDYTPGTFDILYKNRGEYTKWNGNDKGNSRVNTTLAKQLALWVTLYSPLQMASDLIGNYEGHPAFDFFETLPSRWNESKVLAAEVGDYLVVARRSGDNWYIGATTDEENRNIDLDLSFLKKGSRYKATIYADNDETDLRKNPTAISINEVEVGSEDIINISMSAGGGQAMTLVEL